MSKISSRLDVLKLLLANHKSVFSYQKANFNGMQEYFNNPQQGCQNIFFYFLENRSCPNHTRRHRKMEQEKFFISYKSILALLKSVSTASYWVLIICKVISITEQVTLADFREHHQNFQEPKN